MFHNPEELFGGSSRLLSVVDLIYQSVEDATLWPTILGEVEGAIGGTQTLLFAPGVNAGALPVLRSHRTAFELARSFVDYYASVNVLAEPCDRMFPTGTVRYSHLAVPDAEFEHSEFYNDFFAPNDMYYSVGLKLPVGDQVAYLSCQRSKASGAFAEMEGWAYKTLQPHIQRALTLHGQLKHAETKALGLETALDAFEHAVFGLGRNGRVVLFNSRAEAIVRTGDCLRLIQGRLSTVVPGQNRQLQHMLSSALENGVLAGAGQAMLLGRRSGEQALRVTVTPFRSVFAGSPAPLAALVFVSDPASVPQSRGTLLRALYGLTPAEARVADLLLQGLDTAEVADQLRLALGTVRLQTKRVLSKTGMRRQAELMQLGLSLPAVAQG